MTDTPERLLESACEVFAEHGFEDANVADICHGAEANIAAINYHYGGKKNLYVAALKTAAEWANEEFPLTVRAEDIPDPGERIGHFIRAQFCRTFLGTRSRIFPRLLVHEMTAPTFAHEQVFRELLRPNLTFLRDTLNDFMGPDVPEEKWRPCVTTIISLFAFHQFNPRARDRVFRQAKGEGYAVEDRIEHTIRFALAGLAASREAFLQEIAEERAGAKSP